ncbi:MAG: ISAzo13-like element transposase-related protein, partial [Methylobacter sp.]
MKLGHGGVEYVSGLFGIDPKTVRKGINGHSELLEANFLQLLAEFTAGDPMREGVLWTNLSRREISRRLAGMGSPGSRHTVRKLLKKHGLGQRKARKKKSLGNHPDRDVQFQNIAKFKAAYQDAGDPVISMDTKKKELIGNF